ncbi:MULTISPECIES: toll/interleukin-1 receptor domain-containing protein [Sphingobacterium]|uniref:TIR domain-containing protein n=1 Tax=Sphingobacterium psychroaquaticum TaxID=561061 RepID=A0A1X7LE80_9SPHI|nr:toll/interleukin-1 receptor domain-containing protein [Sphingobacterium psychroaquaticum]SMG51683.1 hypothetical protein SAMN05660862_0019 [Sphingobacterium psychroaquaticum]
MKTFLSYSYGDDTTVIRNLLTENGIEIFDSIKEMQYGNSLQQTIKNAVNNCDFVFFIYSKMNPHIAFEVGLAVALNKPIFTVFAGGEEDTFLLDSTYVHAYPTESAKIGFSLELFLKNLSVKKRKRKTDSSSLPKFYGGGQPIPAKNNFDIIERYNTATGKSGSELEIFFQDLLRVYNVNVVKNSTLKNDRKWSPDFSIWSDELSSLLDNPIVIEVKTEINRSNLETIINNLTKLNTINTLVGSCLIFYDRLGNLKQEDLPITPRQLFISIRQLVFELQFQDFVASIKKIRNNLVHNI